jgi:hypothetical protein
MLPKTQNSLPRNWGGNFCFNLLGVAKSIAITMNRTQGFTVEVGSLILFVYTQNISKVAYKTPPFLQYHFEQLIDSRPKCQVRLCQMYPSFPLASILLQLRFRNTLIPLLAVKGASMNWLKKEPGFRRNNDYT